MPSLKTSRLYKQKVAIIGYGAEGQALHQYLVRQGVPEITICDRQAVTLEEPTATHLQTGPGYLAHLADFDVVFRSPGVSLRLPEIQAFLQAGGQLDSLTKLFCRECPARIIGVTGSNGKTTTSALIAHLLRGNADPKRAYGQVWESGNDHTPLLAQLDKMQADDLVVLELSSFQLYDLAVSPPIAVITNLAINHLDWHPDLEDYAQAKANIFRHQKAGAHCFINGEDGGSQTFLKMDSAGQRHIYGAQDAQALAAAGSLPYLTHPANLAVACQVAKLCGLTDQQTRTALQTFRLPEQRLELVTTVDDTAFYNSSSATTPESTACDLRLCQPLRKRIVLIAGGKNKGMPFTGIALAIQETRPWAVILIGQVAQALQKEILAARPGQAVQICATLEEALAIAHRLAAPGGIVLFSPGFASFDMFENSKQRGKLFAQLAQQLKPLLTTAK